MPIFGLKWHLRSVLVCLREGQKPFSRLSLALDLDLWQAARCGDVTDKPEGINGEGY